MDNKEKSPEQELIESIGLMIEKGVESNTNIYTGVVKGVDGKRAVVTVNGRDQNVAIATADVSSGNVVKVFVPSNNMSAAFIIKAESSGGGGDTTTNYGDLTNKPSINGNTLIGNKTSAQIGVYGTGNPPPYPVTSVNGQTGDVTIEAGGNVDSVNGKTGTVVLTQDDVGNGTTYVRTHNDFTDVLKAQINTNEDNIAMAESDIDGLQTDVGTLKTNVTNLQTALTSKQDAIVGAASTITEDNLATDRALISNSSGKVAVSNVTSTELGYLDGVTSNVQTQLDKKLEKAPVTSVDGETGAVTTNAVKTTAQSLTNAQKAQARTNIGAGTSSFSGSYNDLTNKPTIPDPYTLPVASSTTLGGVKPVAKTSDMTQNVGVDASGALYTAPGGGGTGSGDMLKSVYDATGTVEQAGGIADYVANNAPVTSVNGKTGAVKIVKGDVGLGKVRNQIQYSAENPPPYPVTSVNGKTGDVVVEGAQILVDGILEGDGTGNIFAAQTVQAETADAQVLPTVTTSDNGKFLRVVSGQWQAVAVPDANGQSF